MGALRDPKLEKFAQALAENLIAGVKRCKAAEEAAKAADYKGSSLAANARSRAQRADVKARVAELLRPGIAKGEAKIALRRSELVALDVADIEHSADGLRVTIRRSLPPARQRQGSASHGRPWRRLHAEIGGVTGRYTYHTYHAYPV